MQGCRTKRPHHRPGCGLMRKLVELLRRVMGVSALNAELQRIVKRLEAIERQASLELKWRGHFTDKVDALLRRSFISDLVADQYPTALLSQRFKLLSQNE